MVRKGRVFLISGPSGSGKDTVLKAFLRDKPGVKLSISWITRPMRAGEVDGEKYRFVSRDVFEQMLEDGAFLEHNEYIGQYYGTPKEPVFRWLEEGFDVILELDVNGAMSVMAQLPDAVSVFIQPPSVEVLEERLRLRGTESAGEVQRRVFEARREMAMAGRYDYVIVNDEVAGAVRALEKIMENLE